MVPPTTDEFEKYDREPPSFVISDWEYVEYEIISWAQIWFHDAQANPRVVSLYRKSESTTELGQAYEFVCSTLSEHDSSFFAMDDILRQANEVTEKESGVDFRVSHPRLTVERPTVERPKVTDFHAELPEHRWIFHGSVKENVDRLAADAIKSLEINWLTIFTDQEDRYCIVIGFQSENVTCSAHFGTKISVFQKELEKALSRMPVERSGGIADERNPARELSNTLSRSSSETAHYRVLRARLALGVLKSDEAYSQHMRTLRNTVRSDEIDNLHLFMYHAEDRRLYYTFSEEYDVQRCYIAAYVKALHEDPDDQLALDSRQRIYVMENVRRKLYLTSDAYDVNGEVKNLLKEVESVLDHLGNPDWLEAYFKDYFSDRFFLLTFIMSCIPQEPWTGVAGYTAQTMLPEISGSGANEVRWKPNHINSSYFYRKLTVYERSVGVAGVGTMAAFPIIDGGQIGGVLFATSQNTDYRSFSVRTLDRLRQMSIEMRPFVLAKRATDFIETIFDETFQTRDILAVMGKYIPLLINPALVVIWRDNSKHPRPEKPAYLFGYEADAEGSDNALLPPRYVRFDSASTYTIGFSFSHYDALVETLGKQESVFLDGDAVDRTLPDDIREQYRRKTKSEGMGELSGIAINSGMCLAHKYGDDDLVYIVVYVSETVENLRRSQEVNRHKMEMVRFLLEFAEPLRPLFRLLVKHQASGHEVRRVYIQPISGCIELMNEAWHEADKAVSILQTFGEARSLTATPGFEQYIETLRGLRSALDSWNGLLGNLQCSKDCLAELVALYDPSIRKDPDGVLVSRRIDLRAILDRLPSQLRANWQYLQYSQSGLYLLYSQYARIDIEYRASIGAKGIYVWGVEERVHRAFFNILNNIYSVAVLPRDLVESDSSRAATSLSVFAEEDGYIHVIIEDRGMGMDAETRKWVEDVIRDASNINEEIDEALHNRYLRLKRRDHGSGNGFGIYSASRRLTESRCNDDGRYGSLRLVKSIEDQGTTFEILLPTAPKPFEEGLGNGTQNSGGRGRLRI